MRVMETDQSNLHRDLESLLKCVHNWTVRQDLRALERWLAERLDESGTPIRLPLPSWIDCLANLAEARRKQVGWPKAIDDRIEQFLEACLRFTRPNGEPAIFGSAHQSSRETTSLFRYWADVFVDRRVTRVIDWWFPTGRENHTPPPLPAWSSPDRILASLRADWRPDGDFLVVNHHAADTTSEFELFGGGVPWLSSSWNTRWSESASTTNGARATPRQEAWKSTSKADLLEWSTRSGTTRIVRTIVMLRGRSLALLAEQVDRREPGRLDSLDVLGPGSLDFR